MLFQSHLFLFAFLPAVVLGHQLLVRSRADRRWHIAFVIAASLLFYGALSLASLPFLALSCALNFAAGRLILRALAGNHRLAGNIAAAAIGLNLALLIAVKITADLGLPGMPQGYFPVGASFITFIQIVYIVETLGGAVGRLTFGEYLQFSTFFGYVTSGPVVASSEIVPQEREREGRAVEGEVLLAALGLFAMGLFKKLVIADSIAPHADALFASARDGLAIAPADAWFGSMLYMLQLYFDFSGYSDMAIAIGCMLGCRLPLNFNSPFKATSAMDYWRRWHMTLTRFITHYLYAPVAVAATRWANGRRVQSGAARFALLVAGPTILAFLVAGVWHGNGWTFAAYGLWWGIALSVYQAWARWSPWRLPAGAAWAITLLTALGSLVLFRADTLAAAATIAQAAFGFGAAAPQRLPGFVYGIAAALLVALAVLPNSQQILGRFRISSDEVEQPPARWTWLMWSTSPAGAVFIGLTIVAALVLGGGPTQFLYYKF
jgi:D-alanyl-lipoteichoic acid acyltransferase DltB (MBOAT superfamily)